MAPTFKNLLILVIILIKTNLNSFIIQETLMKKDNKEIILYSDLHLPYLEKSIEKHKKQNKTIKQELNKSKDLLVLFEGYKEDQKVKFNKKQIKNSKCMSPLAYFDILTQTLKNPNVKIIPTDPRKTINQTFLSCNQAISILTNNNIEELLDGSAIIKKENSLTVNERLTLKNLEKACPAFDDIFLKSNNFIKKTKSKLTKLKDPKLENIINNKLKSLEKSLNDCKKDLQNSFSKNFAQISKTPVLSLMLPILQKYYANSLKIWKPRLKCILDSVFILHEESCNMLAINMLLKALSAEKLDRIAFFAGQLNIKSLKKLLEEVGYKKARNIQNDATASFVKKLDNELSETNLNDINSYLENNVHLINMPNEAFKLISKNLQIVNRDSFFTKLVNMLKSFFVGG